MKTSKFQFINPYLLELRFELNSEFDVEKDDIEINNSFNIQVKKSKNENRANVELTLISNMDNDNAPFKLIVKVASDFKWEDIEESKVDSLLEHNAPALLLSYMRPIVANVTNSSKFPAYNLPFIDFTK